MNLAASLLILALAIGLGGPAEARWLKADAPHFIVYSRGGERSLRDYTRELETFDALLRRDHGVSSDASPTKVTVVLLPSPGSLKEVWPHHPEHVVGVYRADAEQAIAFAEPSDSAEGWFANTDIIFHEYTHHFVAQYFPGYYPTWINEGLADYFGGTKFRDGKIEYGQGSAARLYPLLHSQWMPISELVSRQASSGGRREEMFYPESWAMVHYLMHDGEHRRQLTNYIVAMRRGDSPMEAFPKAFGMDFAAFQKVLERYPEQMKFSRIPELKTAGPPITVTPLPESADRVFLLYEHIRWVGSDAPEKDKLLTDARRGARDDPEDPMTLRTLAWAELKFGDPADSEAPLDHLIKAHPDDVEAIYLKAKRLVIAASRDPDHHDADINAARTWLAKAYALDPNFYPVIYLSGMTHMQDAGEPSENTVEVFEVAHDLAPQVDEIAMNTAVILMRKRRWAEVIHVLEPIVYEPHPGQWLARAQSMLTTARERATAADAKPAAEVPQTRR